MTAAAYLGGLASAGLLGYFLGASRAYHRVRRSVARAGEWLAPRLRSPQEAEAVQQFVERIDAELAGD